MSDYKKFLDLTNEITALKEQHEANLADYSAKVSEFDKEIKALAVKKADLEKKILVLVNEKDSLPGLINKAIKEACPV
jgi:predicted  nucleic acid-binding Zn-ribbon protein